MPEAAQARKTPKFLPGKQDNGTSGLFLMLRRAIRRKSIALGIFTLQQSVVRQQTANRRAAAFSSS